MATSFRPALTAGLAALCATAVTFTAAPPQSNAVLDRADRSVSAHVDLRAGTELLMPAKLVAAVASLSETQVAKVAEALAVTPTATPLTPLADAIDGAYNAIEPWVRYGFQVAASALAWVPYVGIFANQIMVVYNFVESLINSGVYNTTDWMRGDGNALKNVADWVVDLGLAVVWLGIDEVGAWVPLPPIGNYPPRPPYADLPEGGLGNGLVAASQILANASNAIWDLWDPIKSGIDTGVDAVGNALGAISFIPFVPVINFQIQAGWDLLAGEGDALTGFAHDMINAGNQWVSDVVKAGIITATVNAGVTTLNSIGTRGSQAVQALLDWGQAQIENLFGIGYGRSAASVEAAAVERKTVGVSAVSLDSPAVTLPTTGGAAPTAEDGHRAVDKGFAGGDLPAASGAATAHGDSPWVAAPEPTAQPAAEFEPPQTDAPSEPDPPAADVEKAAADAPEAGAPAADAPEAPATPSAADDTPADAKPNPDAKPDTDAKPTEKHGLGHSSKRDTTSDSTLDVKSDAKPDKKIGDTRADATNARTGDGAEGAA